MVIGQERLGNDKISPDISLGELSEEKKMKRIVSASAMIVFLAFGSPALAQSNDSKPEDLAVEGIAKLMDALGAFRKSIPQYEAPTMNENGDIIIRRKRPKNDDKKPEPKLEETST